MTQQQEFMVAVCDILGFSHLVQTSSLEQVVNNSLGWLRKSLYHSLHKREFPDAIPRKEQFLGNEHVGAAWFSDTFLLYSRADDREAINQLIQTVGWLLFETMMAGRMIRGGISFGEAYIDEQESIFVGKPIVEAYRLEKSQQWAGVALTEHAVERIPLIARSGDLGDWWVVPYDVPLKDGNKKRTLAINWTWGGHSWWRVSWSESKKLPDESDWAARPDVCEKFINTKAFHKAICRNCLGDD